MRTASHLSSVASGDSECTLLNLSQTRVRNKQRFYLKTMQLFASGLPINTVAFKIESWKAYLMNCCYGDDKYSDCEHITDSFG